MATIVTNLLGEYGFLVPRGRTVYRVLVAPPNGYETVLRDLGGDEALDSDIDPVSRRSDRVDARADHVIDIGLTPLTSIGDRVRAGPFEIERMQWEEGDTIAGLLLEGDPKVGTGSFRLVCDGMEPPELETEDFEVITAPAEPLEIPAGPGPARESEPRF